MPGPSTDPLYEIKKLVAGEMGWTGDEVPQINLAVVEIVDITQQTEQLALGGDLRGDNQFIIADMRNGIANNLYWPTGTIDGNKYKITDVGVNRTLQHKDWWYEVMDMNDYLFCLFDNEKINSMISYLQQSVGKTIGYVRIMDPDA